MVLHVSLIIGGKSLVLVRPPDLFILNELVVIFFFFFFKPETLWTRAAELKTRSENNFFFFLNFTAKKHISLSWVRQNEILATPQVSCAPLWHRVLCSQHPVPEMKSFGACSLWGNVDFSSKPSVLATGFINA